MSRAFEQSVGSRATTPVAATTTASTRAARARQMRMRTRKNKPASTQTAAKARREIATIAALASDRCEATPGVEPRLGQTYHPALDADDAPGLEVAAVDLAERGPHCQFAPRKSGAKGTPMQPSDQLG